MSSESHFRHTDPPATHLHQPYFVSTGPKKINSFFYENGLAFWNIKHDWSNEDLVIFVALIFRRFIRVVLVDIVLREVVAVTLDRLVLLVLVRLRGRRRRQRGYHNNQES